MGNMSGSYGSHYTLWASITENSYDIANNTSNVTVKLYLTFDGSSWYAYTNYTTYGEIQINRWNDTEYASTGAIGINSISFSSGVYKDLLLAEWTGDVYHNSDGKKTVKVKCSWNTDTTRMGSGSCTAELKLTDIPRYAGFNGHRINATNLTSAEIAYNSNKSLIAAQYSLNGGPWQSLNIKSGTWNEPNNTVVYAIDNLQPNTSYNIQTRIAHVWELWTYSDTLTFTTKDIAKISSLNNFEHGSSPTVGITNPGSISSLSLLMKVGDTQILSRTVSAGNNTISFSDTELDNLYKKYGSSNSLTATFVLSGSGYTNSKTCTITLKGNQKTIRTNVSGAWKRGKLWTNVNGTWKRGVLWTNVSGTWKRGI